jgi:hypothetical protein
VGAHQFDLAKHEDIVGCLRELCGQRFERLEAPYE